MMFAPRGFLVRRVLPSVLAWTSFACTPDETTTGLPESEVAPAASLASDVQEGREIFRFDTFGNETFWTDSAGLHNVINTLPPLTALQVAGLKVDARALPDALRDLIRNGDLDLSDPANTIALIGLDAVLGVK